MKFRGIRRIFTRTDGHTDRETAIYRQAHQIQINTFQLRKCRLLPVITRSKNERFPLFWVTLYIVYELHTHPRVYELKK